MSSKYWHYPIQEGANKSFALEFSHIVGIGRKGQWNEDIKFSIPNCKINVFLKGDFSVIVNNKVFSPIYGDLCFLAPFEAHFGKIPKDTELDYFQLNVGTNAFDRIPGGKKILERLTDREQNKNIFVRPRNADAEMLIAVCRKIEAAIDQHKIALAFAESIKFLDILNRVYSEPIQSEPTVLSMNCSKVIKYIEENFGEQITISQLAELCGVSESWLSRSFKAEVGITIHSYLLIRRMRAALLLLDEKPVTEI